MAIGIEHTAECINILGRFCGKRDISSLTGNALTEKYGLAQADVMVLFGGSILCGGDMLAEAMKNRIAGKYVIVGGAGHTTERLRQKMQTYLAPAFTECSAFGHLSEAELFESYLEEKYNLRADYLECRSTNCGTNITLLLELLREKQVSFQSIILTQDSSMQHRMEAGLRKYCENNLTIINYAAYSAEVVVRNNALCYQQNIPGMWEMEDYISLLMGEIPRLWDTAEGYGPRGKNYIAHVDIPQEVLSAYHDLSEVYAHLIREANPKYGDTASQ